MSWRDDLKPGDPVCRKHGHFREPQYDFTTVEKVTKTQIKLAGREIRYRKRDGRSMAKRDAWWGIVDQLEPDTPKLRLQAERAEASRGYDTIRRNLLHGWPREQVNALMVEDLDEIEAIMKRRLT